MGDNYKIFNHGTGLIIVIASKSQIPKEFENNPKWVKLHTPTPLHLFASVDIASEIERTGLPKQVFKFVQLHKFDTEE